MTLREIPGLDDALRGGVYQHCFSAGDRELGGVLVGSVTPDGQPSVVGAIPAVQAAERRAQITFTQESWAEILRELDQRHPDHQIVGWYHTHPGYGLFLSEQDRFIHRHFFSNPAQIALVIDPLAREEGVFGWVDGEIGEWFRRPVSDAAAPDSPLRGARLPAPAPGHDPAPPASPAHPAPGMGESTVAPSIPVPEVEVQLLRQGTPPPARPYTPSAAQPGGAPRATTGEWLPVATCIYLWVIGLAAGACFWELFLR